MAQWLSSFSNFLIFQLPPDVIIEQFMPDAQPISDFYCPQCANAVTNPLVCGDCHALICRECGTPLERIDDLGIG